jgi:GT2 family glycosyltransferase
MEKIIAKHTAAVSISVVSHTQIGLVENLLHDIAQHCQTSSLELILTLNQDEALPFSVDSFPFPINVIRNSVPQGFATNHNQAFRDATGQFFCVMNPDIRLDENPFPALLDCLQDSSVGVVAPVVLAENGEMEDSARRFPTPLKILCKAFGGCKGSDYVVNDEPIFPDWVGGMFMLFPRGIFEQLDGFDPRYFLYYEDVDLCARLRLLGYKVVACPKSKVIHYAQRSSHSSLRYLRWHLISMMRFFLSTVFLRVQCRKWI